MPPSKEYTASESSPPSKHSVDAGSSADNCEHYCRRGVCVRFYDPVLSSHPPLVFLYLGTTYHDVVEQNRIEEKRREERCVCCTQNEAKFWVYYRSFGCRGLLKEEEKKAHIKNLATPLVPNFKIFWGAPPQARNLIGACSL
jgi:hypothetical protein